VTERTAFQGKNEDGEMVLVYMERVESITYHTRDEVTLTTFTGSQYRLTSEEDNDEVTES